MRTFLAAVAIALALIVPTSASATEAPLPPALMCVAYGATTVCMLLGDDATTYSWSTPWYSGVVSGPPIQWPAR